MRFYTVGGAVRDLLIGKAPRDHDIVFDGSADEFIRSYPSACKAGAAFPICILGGVEYASFRGETLEDDLYARDFTINAIAADESGRLVAHPTSFEDIRNGILRCTSPTSLVDDPCRVYRAARFLAQYPWLTPHALLLEQMRETGTSGILLDIAPERVAAELRKALSAPLPGRFFTILYDTECLEAWFPFLQQAAYVTAGPPPFHSETTFQHTCEIMNCVSSMFFSSKEVRKLAVWMACCHDFGKVKTPKNMLPRHYGHDKRGETYARELGKRLKLPVRYILAGSHAARWHMVGGMYDTLRAIKRVDLLMSLNSQALLEPFFALVSADSGKDFFKVAQQELNIIRNVSLPDEWRNLGVESGRRLREMRGSALSKARLI